MPIWITIILIISAAIIGYGLGIGRVINSCTAQCIHARARRGEL